MMGLHVPDLPPGHAGVAELRVVGGDYVVVERGDPPPGSGCRKSAPMAADILAGSEKLLRASHSQHFFLCGRCDAVLVKHMEDI